MIYKFKASDIRPLWQHAKQSPKHITPYEPDREAQPGLILVKDQGVYLMSNGEPGLLKTGTKSSHVVVYAEGHNPDVDDFDDWYVGGDDFAVGLDWPTFWEAVTRDDKKKFVLITVTGDEVKAQAC